MWQFFKDNQFILGALTGSLASYLLGLLVSYFRREKRWLGYSIESRNVLKADHPLVSIKFNERDIHRLDYHRVFLRNIGNRSLTNVPIRLVAPRGTTILEYEVRGPDGSHLSAIEEDPATIVVSCDLLNPREVAAVAVTAADSSDSELRVIARAEGLVIKKIVGRSATIAMLKQVIAGLERDKETLNKWLNYYTPGKREPEDL